jgi:C4-dicarboxylate-specific signal transduction histidine kinase
MKRSLNVRFTIVIVGLIIVSVVNLSGVLYIQFNEIIAEMARSNDKAMSDALLGQAKPQAVARARYIAKTLTNDLYQNRIDRIRDVLALANSQYGVAYVIVCDPEGRVIADGLSGIANFDKKAASPLTPKILAAQQGGVAIIENGILHIGEPITIGTRTLGEIKIGVSLASIEQTIGVTRVALDAISARGRIDHIYATAVGMAILAVLSILLSLLISRWLARPIEVEFESRATELEKTNQALSGEIAERKRVESRFLQLHSDLAHMGRIGTVGEMAGGLAHELNQPLSVISSYASGGLARLRAGTVKPSELTDAFVRIVDQVGRAGEIIRWIRGFVRKSEPLRARVDINAVILESLDVLHDEPFRLGIDLQVDLAEDLQNVVADKIQLQQAILNLIGNALDSVRTTGASGRVIARSMNKGAKFIQIDIEDNGIGLSADIGDKAFDPFFTTKANGLGLGLSLCRSIIQTHGGELWASAAIGNGAIFHFTLPADETFETRNDS